MSKNGFPPDSSSGPKPSGAELVNGNPSARLERYWHDTRVMVFVGKFDTHKDTPSNPYGTISLAELRDLVLTPAASRKEDALATIGSSYCAFDARRHEVQTQHGEYWLLRFDIDHGNPSLDDVCSSFQQQVGPDAVIIVYSTSSATAEARRWRVLIPLREMINHELRRACEQGLREWVEILWDFEFDPALDRAGQHIYLPAVAPQKRLPNGKPVYYEQRILGREPLDLKRSSLYSMALARIEAERQQEEQRQAALEDRREQAREQRESATRRGYCGLSPIDWFNQNTDLEELLLEVGYEPSSSDSRDFRSPMQTSGTYATRVYGDYFVTLSASDAEAGLGKATRSDHRVGDAFSVFKHFMHGGDQARALAAIRAQQDFAEQAESVAHGESAAHAEKTQLLITPITPTELLSARSSPRIIVPNFLYADVRARIGPGGAGKTTLAIYEAVRLALGFPLWGRKPEAPVRTVFITREDSREIFVARIRGAMDALMLEEDARLEALKNLMIIDLSGYPFRLSSVEQDMVVPNYQNLEDLIDVLSGWKPDWVICDPLVSFGVGESRVNDAEQGLIEAFRMIRNRLECCIEGIHHTGKMVAREKMLDQYAGRGGSALADGCRMVAVTQPLDDEAWERATGFALEEGWYGLVMALPKISYTAPQPTIYIKRRDATFVMVEGIGNSGPDVIRQQHAEKVYKFLLETYQKGERYSKTGLDAQSSHIKLRRQELRDALEALVIAGRVIYHDARGKAGAHYEPLVLRESVDDDFLK